VRNHVEADANLVFDFHCSTTYLNWCYPKVSLEQRSFPLSVKLAIFRAEVKWQADRLFEAMES
jgi:hypothetical protein